MLKDFMLPDLGEGLTESEIVSWRVAAGDHVTLNQIIADVETAKAVVELPSPFDGVIQALHAEAGDTVEVGERIVTFELESDEEPVVEPVETTPAADDAPEPNLVGYGAGPESKNRPARRKRADAPAATPVGAAPAGHARHVERPRSTRPCAISPSSWGSTSPRSRERGPMVSSPGRTCRRRRRVVPWR